MPRKARRRIKDARIRFISLCGAGRNLMRTLYKSADGTVELQTLIAKADMEKGLITAVVYVPEHPDYDGDVADATTIEKMAHSFAEEGFAVDINHDQKALDSSQVLVVESFIIQKGDPRFVDLKDEDGHAVDATAGWATVLKVKDEKLRAKYRSGEWGGVSMFGPATVAPITKAQEAEGDKTMDPKELAEALAKSLTDAGLTGDKIAEVCKAAAEAAVAKQKPEPKPEGDEFVAPVFEGEMTSENLATHAIAVKKAKIAHETKSADPEKLAELAKQLAELEKSDEDETDEDDKGTVRKASSQSTADQKTEQTKLQKAYEAEVETSAQMLMATNPSITHEAALAKARAVVIM
jgi:hypothetical protein